VKSIYVPSKSSRKPAVKQIENDGSPTSTIIKSVKRAMAAQYSREQLVKVFAGSAT
jgi:hypothetical protein